MVFIPRYISYIERSKYMAICFSATQSDSNRSSEAIQIIYFHFLIITLSAP